MKQQMIQLLHEAEGFVSGQELCDHFGVSRTAVWKVINQLKEEGYIIESVTRKGYRLLEAPDLMTAEEIFAARGRNHSACGPVSSETPTNASSNGALRDIAGEKLKMGCRILSYDTIDSTNIRAAKLDEEGYPSGSLVVSEEQTAGKGRRGRSWSSPSGKGIFMSLMIRPEINPNHASMLTLVAALAVSRAISRVLGTKLPENALAIKWPNDIVLNGKKIVGILTEMNAQMDYVNHIVIGIGINVHNTDFPDDIKDTATSLYKESGVRIKRADLIAAFLDEFEHDYEIFLKTEDLSALQKEYNKLLINRNRQVKVLDPKGEFTGIAKGIDVTGELLVEVEHSGEKAGDPAQEIEVKKISSGEVSVRGIYGYV